MEEAHALEAMARALERIAQERAEKVLEQLRGAVSEEMARAMAKGALEASRAEVAVSVTGIAGPDGGTAAKPVGLVHFACARRGGPIVTREERFGDIGRDAVRIASVRVGLDLLEAAAQ